MYQNKTFPRVSGTLTKELKMYAELCYNDDMKTCSKCKKEKSLSEFKKDNRVKSGFQAACKPCVYSTRKRNHEAYRKTERRRELKKYGLTLEQYDHMRELQNYRCSICDKHESKGYRAKLFIDHCHVTGKVRELLCDKCNSGLGSFLDNPRLTDRATSYLKRHRS